MDIVIIRSPAIYGVNAPGNFGLIEKFIRYGIPLPVGSIDNKRSLVAIKNLVTFITLCVEHPRFLQFIFNIIGKRKVGESLMSDLQLDIDRSLELLEWSPPFNPRVLIESLG